MTIAQLNKLAQEIANQLGDLDEAALIKVLDFVKAAAEPTASPPSSQAPAPTMSDAIAFSHAEAK